MKIILSMLVLVMLNTAHAALEPMELIFPESTSSAPLVKQPPVSSEVTSPSIPHTPNTDLTKLPTTDIEENDEETPAAAPVNASRFKDKYGYGPEDTKLNAVYASLSKDSPINKVALHNSFKFYEKNKGKDGLDSTHMAIVDYTKPGSAGRYYWINLKNGKIEHTLKVAHGSGSGGGAVPNMCNGANGSLATPCGFHKYGSPYISGRNGLSIKMQGLQNINSNSEQRAVVAHSAAYVIGSRGMGRNSYSAWVNKSGSLISALNDPERFNQVLPSSIKPDGRVTTASANTSSIGRSSGCHAFGAEDFAKIAPYMKNVLSYNYFGEGTEGPTKTAFSIPKGSKGQVLASAND